MISKPSFLLWLNLATPGTLTTPTNVKKHSARKGELSVVGRFFFHVRKDRKQGFRRQKGEDDRRGHFFL
jgi:hypothetical protein